MPSTMTVEQASTVLNNIYEQITGKSLTSVVGTADFVSTANALLLTGRDPIMNALSQMWSRTIFAYRDYRAPFSSLEMDIERFGNAVRKLSPISRQMIDDESFTWPVAYDSTNANPIGDGESVDMWKIAKQRVQQMNFYGTAVYEQKYTVFKDQLDNSLTSAEEFSRFNSMNLAERNNEKEQYKEAVARGLQLNFLAGIIDENNSDRVVHLLTEYNTATGLATPLTIQTVYQPDNFAPFMRWCWARIKTIIRLMGARSNRFQTVVNNEPVYRFTRPENMRVALLASAYDQIETMVMSDTYHDDYLKGVTFESVDYWQSIASPAAINILPIYTGTNGQPTSAAAAVEKSNVFGLLHDKDAIGYSMVNSWSAITPLNITGGYWNEAYHARIKTIQDNTEKAVVLLLD